MDFQDIPAWVRDALRRDARFGYFALRAMDEVPQVFVYSGEFTSTSKAQAPIQLEPDQEIPADMYIQEMLYDVERPNFAPGGVLTPESNLANAQQPGLKVLLEVGGGFLGEQYNVNIGLAKIQMVIPWVGRVGQANCAWPGKWRMTYSQQLVVQVFLDRNLGDTEVPYEISLALHAKRILCPGFCRLSLGDVEERIADEFGISNLKKHIPALGINPHWEDINPPPARSVPRRRAAL